VQGRRGLTSQSGGIGMAILGFRAVHGMGVSAIVGLGNKSDIDEDDLLTFFESDDNTTCVAMHLEDLKDGRAFVETASGHHRRSRGGAQGGPHGVGARAASSHTGALAGDDKVYDDILRQAGVVPARRAATTCSSYARGLPVLPTPKGENVVIITGAGGSGVLLSDACVDNGLS
jgi:acyl-CoA synthetase (NDP forming)